MLQISIDGARERTHVDSPVEGTVDWSFDSDPQDLSIRFIWFTEGVGSQDVGLIGETTLPAERSGRQTFSFSLKDAPECYAGLLFSVKLALEASASEPEENVREEISLKAR